MEYKFRGLRKEYNPAWNKSKWAYGNLLNHCSIGFVGADLNSYEYAEVIPETVGQFTGLQDKNKIDIYEGDKLMIMLPLGGFWGNVKRKEIGEVRYEKDYGAFIVEWEYSKHQHHEILNCDIAFEGKITGNIREK